MTPKTKTDPLRIDREPLTVDQERMQRFLENYEHAFCRPTGRACAELLAEDGVMIHPERANEPLHGRLAVAEFFDQILDGVPDLAVEPLAAAAAGDILFVHFRGQGTFAGTKVVWEGIDRYDFEGDEAVRAIGYFNPEPLLSAVARGSEGAAP
jgi:predicted SnoaL-like aldol condensation-catalyzing enzyme